MLVTVLSEWIRSIISQCKAAGIPVYVKQLRTEEAKQSAMSRSDTKGANPQMWAEDLLLREFPGVRGAHFYFEVKK